MSKHYALAAQKRDRAGKGVARTLRRENRIPAVIYGDNKEPVSISLPVKETMLEYLKGHMLTTLCDLNIDGQKKLVLVRDVQLHPVKDTIVHVDFMRVTPKMSVTVHVPLEFVNEDASEALKHGAVLNIVAHDISLRCKATDIPESIQIDLTGKEIGDAIRLSDIKLPAGTEALVDDEEEFTICTIMAPRVHAEEQEAPAAAAAEATPAA